jgi:hypothetical protein
MATLQEAQEKLQEWKNKKNVLLGDNKLPIPEDAFEEIITDVLMRNASALEIDITRVMSMPLTALYPQPIPAHEIWPTPGPAVPPVAKEEIKQAMKATAAPAPAPHLPAVQNIPVAPTAPIPYQPVTAQPAASPPAEAVQPKKTKGKSLN